MRAGVGAACLMTFLSILDGCCSGATAHRQRRACAPRLRQRHRQRRARRFSTLGRGRLRGHRRRPEAADSFQRPRRRARCGSRSSSTPATGRRTRSTQIRTGLTAFLEALPPDSEVMVISTGRQVRVRLPPTTDRAKALSIAKGLFSDGGATPLRDALLEIDERFFRKIENRWPVFVIVTGDSAESSAAANETKFNKWLNDLPARGISAHAFALKYRGGGLPGSGRAPRRADRRRALRFHEHEQRPSRQVEARSASSSRTTRKR